MRTTAQSDSWWFTRQLMILPMLATCLLVLLLYGMLVAPMANGNFSFVHFFSFDTKEFSGLLVDIIWWQALADSLLNAAMYSLTEIAVALTLILLIRDNLPFKKIRMTMIASTWLVPPAVTASTIDLMLEQTPWILSGEQVEYAATVWRNSGFVAFVLYLVWPKSLRDSHLVTRVYQLKLTGQITLFLSQTRHLLLAASMLLLVIHFDPATQWLTQHELHNARTINASSAYLQQVSAAQSLSLVIELILLLTAISYIRRSVK